MLFVVLLLSTATAQVNPCPPRPVHRIDMLERDLASIQASRQRGLSSPEPLDRLEAETRFCLWWRAAQGSRAWPSVDCASERCLELRAQATEAVARLPAGDEDRGFYEGMFGWARGDLGGLYRFTASSPDHPWYPEGLFWLGENRFSGCGYLNGEGRWAGRGAEEPTNP